MANNIIVYVGIENFDLVLYLSRILAKLGRKVLVMEYCDIGVFDCIIPKPAGIDSTKEPITYRHVDFAKSPITEDMKRYYDDILITFGFNNPGNLACSRIVIVTDLYLHNITRLKPCLLESNCQDKSFLIRNIVNVNINPKIMQEHFGSQVEKDNLSLINYDENDISNAILCQHNQSIRFLNISNEMKKYLIKEAMKLCPNMKKKKIMDAYTAARKGA